MLLKTSRKCPKLILNFPAAAAPSQPVLKVSQDAGRGIKLSCYTRGCKPQPQISWLLDNGIELPGKSSRPRDWALKFGFLSFGVFKNSGGRKLSWVCPSSLQLGAGLGNSTKFHWDKMSPNPWNLSMEFHLGMKWTQKSWNLSTKFQWDKINPKSCNYNFQSPSSLSSPLTCLIHQKTAILIVL